MSVSDLKAVSRENSLTGKYQPKEVAYVGVFVEQLPVSNNRRKNFITS
jgi:hypothetical protein